jgi:hypothetical protein
VALSSDPFLFFRPRLLRGCLRFGALNDLKEVRQGGVMLGACLVKLASESVALGNGIGSNSL